MSFKYDRIYGFKIGAVWGKQWFPVGDLTWPKRCIQTQAPQLLRYFWYPHYNPKHKNGLFSSGQIVLSVVSVTFGATSLKKSPSTSGLYSSRCFQPLKGKGMSYCSLKYPKSHYLLLSCGGLDVNPVGCPNRGFWGILWAQHSIFVRLDSYKKMLELLLLPKTGGSPLLP